MTKTDPFVIVNTNDWQQGTFVDRDGTCWRVVGECDTDRCGAVCCKVADWRGRVGSRCELLRDDLRCSPHAERGPACKPVSCLLWPLRPIDVTKTNELAERLGFEWRCHLEVVPWQS